MARKRRDFIMNADSVSRPNPSRYALRQTPVVAVCIPVARVLQPACIVKNFEVTGGKQG